MGRISQTLRLVLPALAALSASTLIAISNPSRLDGQFATTLSISLTMSYLVFEVVRRAGRRYRYQVLWQSSAAASILCYFINELCHFAVNIWAPGAASLLAGLLSLLVRSLGEAEQTATNKNYELLLKNQELQSTKLALLKQEEAERRLLASDLHDQVLSDLRTLSERIRSSEELRGDLDNLINRATSAIREVMEDLSPSVLENLGLKAALDELIRKAMVRENFQGRFIDNCDENCLQKLSPSEQLLLFRIAQEALNNVCKHAKASRVLINLKGTPETIELTVKDNGIGGEYQKIKAESRGLRYMRLKADLIGAVLTISKPEKETEAQSDSARPITGTDPGAGTEVKVVLNLKED